MWIEVKYMAFIDNNELIEANISLNDDQAIEEYFYERGGEDEFHDHGISFEIVDRGNRTW